MATVQIIGSLTYSSTKRATDALGAFDERCYSEFVSSSSFDQDGKTLSIDLLTDPAADCVAYFDGAFITLAAGATAGHIELRWSPGEFTPRSFKSSRMQFDHATPLDYTELALTQMIYPKHCAIAVGRFEPQAIQEDDDVLVQRVRVSFRLKKYDMHWHSSPSKVSTHPQPGGELVALHGDARQPNNAILIDVQSAWGIVLVDVNTSEEITRLFPGMLTCEELAWSPDGRFLAATCHGGEKKTKKGTRGKRHIKPTVMVWDTKNNYKRTKLDWTSKDQLAKKLRWQPEGHVLEASRKTWTLS